MRPPSDGPGAAAFCPAHCLLVLLPPRGQRTPRTSPGPRAALSPRIPQGPSSRAVVRRVRCAPRVVPTPRGCAPVPSSPTCPPGDAGHARAIGRSRCGPLSSGCRPPRRRPHTRPPRSRRRAVRHTCRTIGPRCCGPTARHRCSSDGTWLKHCDGTPATDLRTANRHAPPRPCRSTAHACVPPVRPERAGNTAV
jgi:hypothetical protein